MTMPYAEVRELTDEQAIERYDGVAADTVDSLSFWRDELFRRAEAAQTKNMLRFTKWIAGMTAVMTAATIVNVVLFALA
jgi:hypothetical protein